MQIKNSTSWQTEDLRKLFRRAIKEVEKVEKPEFPFHKRNKHFQLDVLNGEISCCGDIRGRAALGGYWMMIKIATYQCDENGNRINWEWTNENKKKLARMIIHEYYHILGYKNQDKCNYRYDWTKKWNVDWIRDYPIRKKEIIKKPQVDIKLIRYQRAIQNLRSAETRLRRAKTLHKKWLKKVKRYQKVYNFH